MYSNYKNMNDLNSNNNCDDVNEEYTNKEWVYCFSNEDGLFRIGKTINVARRLTQLKKDGPFILCFAKLVDDAPNKVKIICNLLSKYKKDNNLFDITNINSIKQMFELMDGEWYNDRIHLIHTPKKKKELVCNEEVIRQYLEQRKSDELYKLGGSEI